MKVRIIALVVFLVLMGELICASASNLASHDFGNFTADVPTNSTFKMKYVLNPDVIFNFTFSENIRALENHPEYTHPMWTDSVNDFSISYINFSEDGLYDCDNTMSKVYDRSVFMDARDNLYIYNISDSSSNDNHTFAVCKVDGESFLFGGNSMIILTGNDLELLKDVAKSCEFK